MTVAGLSLQQPAQLEQPMCVSAEHGRCWTSAHVPDPQVLAHAAGTGGDGGTWCSRELSMASIWYIARYLALRSATWDAVIAMSHTAKCATRPWKKRDALQMAPAARPGISPGMSPAQSPGVARPHSRIGPSGFVGRPPVATLILSGVATASGSAGSTDFSTPST